jgi:hypothetical protein
MNLKNALWLNGILIAGIGCAAAPSEVRIQGIAVPGKWIEQAEKGDDAGQAQACLSLSKKLWERDVLESLRYLRHGAELRDAECCRQYLAHAESATVNLSQRLYARLYIEGLLRKGPILTKNGEDIRGELYYQLCWAWRYTEPRCAPKTKQVFEAMIEAGLPAGQAKSTFIAQMARETGLRTERSARHQEIQMYAMESADEAKSWLQVPLGDRRETGDWAVADVNVWGGGSDRLFTGTNVLAFLVNAQGEPSFRGNNLWICNLGTTAVHYTSLATGQNNRELLPGREEVLPLASSGFEKAESTTGIPLSVRYRRTLR